MTGMTRMPGDPAPPAQLGETVLALKWDPVLEGNASGAFERLAPSGDLARVRRRGPPVLRAGAELRVRGCRRQYRLCDVRTSAGSRRIGRRRCRFPASRAMPIGTDGSTSISFLLLLNPPSGQIVTANNEVDRGLPYVVTRDWTAPFRAQRITELLGDRRGLDFHAMRQIQADITSRVGRLHVEGDRAARVA